ncbi:MAG: DUF423 domain-containing protein [Alphaproteobacteria bacterium]
MDGRHEARRTGACSGWMSAAGLSGMLAVGFGAFGAHGLERMAGGIDPRDLAAYETGALYHLIHTLAFIGVAMLAREGARLARVAGLLFLLGIVLFSGSLYFLGITGSRALVLVTPVGGLCLIFGWMAVAVASLRLGQNR